MISKRQLSSLTQHEENQNQQHILCLETQAHDKTNNKHMKNMINLELE